MLPHGLYDAAIMGGGDHVVAHGICADWQSACIERVFGRGSAYHRHAQQWGAGVPAQARGDVAHVEGAVFHLFHGDYDKRQYTERHARLQRFGYDPATDLRAGADGCLEWASQRPDLQAWVAGYFARREEDGAPAGARAAQPLAQPV
jgi:hypothetical protein